MNIRKMIGTSLVILVSAVGATSFADDEASVPDPPSEAAAETESEMTPEMEAMRNRLVAASESACSHAFDCAMEGVPESVRGMVDRSQICRMYDRYEAISAAEYNPLCAEAALAYFACIENASCAEITNTRGGEMCGAEGEEARKQCNQE